MPTRGLGRLIYDSGIVLDSNRKYGNPWAVGDSADSEYLWKVDTGEIAFDVLKKLSENYGYSWGCSGYDDGAPYLEEVYGENRQMIEPRWLDNYCIWPYTSFNYNSTKPSWWNYSVPSSIDKILDGASADPSGGGYSEEGFASLSSAYDGVYFTENWIKVIKDYKYSFNVYVQNTGDKSTHMRLYVTTKDRRRDHQHAWHDAQPVYDGSSSVPNDGTWRRYGITLRAEATEYIRPEAVIIDGMGSGEVKFDNMSLYMNSTSRTYRVINDSTTWKFIADAKAIGGGYYKANLNSTTDFLEVVMPGEKFEIVTVMAGDGADAGASYYVYNPDNTLIASGDIDFYNATTRYYGDGVDSTGSNPCIVSISCGSYDYYTIQIKAKNAGATARINTIIAYSFDKSSISETCYTGDYGTNVGTVKSLTVTDTSQDLRNDVLVIGSIKGALVIDPSRSDSDIVNPKNPTFRRIYSRGVNADSMYNPSASNFVGFPKQTIIIEPSIGSNDRAEWLSREFLSRYAVAKKNVNTTIDGHPLLELNDKIAVVDIGRDSVDSSDEMWVTAIDNRLNVSPASFQTTLETTPIRPWDSFLPKPRPFIVDENDVIRNIAIVNQELSGDDVIETDNSVSNKYDPYESEYGRFIKISFDLAIDAHIRVGIYEDNTSQDILIAYLTDQSNEDNGWVTAEQGTLEYFYDGVDVFGDYNEKCYYNNEPIGRGFFANHYTDKTYNKFYLKFDIIDRQTSESYTYLTNSISHEKYFYTQLPSPTTFNVLVDTSKDGIEEFNQIDFFYWDSQYTYQRYEMPFFYDSPTAGDHELIYVFVPVESNRKVFWVEATKLAFYRDTMVRVEYDTIPYSTFKNHRKIISTDKSWELNTKSTDIFKFNVSQALFSQDDIRDKVTYKNWSSGLPSPDSDPNKSWSHRDEDPHPKEYYTGVYADRSKFYVGWFVVFKFSVSDKSGRRQKFTRYYPWLGNGIDSSDWIWAADSNYKSVNPTNTKKAETPDFLPDNSPDGTELSYGVGKHAWKVVHIETKTW